VRPSAGPREPKTCIREISKDDVGRRCAYDPDPDPLSSHSIFAATVTE
jgi:hypothetical protein